MDLDLEYCVKQTHSAVASGAFSPAHIADMRGGCALRREHGLLPREAVKQRAIAEQLLAYERTQKPRLFSNLLSM
jgi:hypothetical protein